MKKHLVHLVVSLLITGIMLLVVFSESSPTELAEVFVRVDASAIATYLLLNLIALVLRSRRYAIALRAMAGKEVLPPGRALIVTAIRNALVDLLPARLGEVSYLYVLNRYGIRFASAVSSFGLCIVLDVFVLSALILVLSLGVSNLGGFGSIAILFALTLAIGTGLYFLDVVAAFAARICEYMSERARSRHFTRLAELCRKLQSFSQDVASDCHNVKVTGSYPMLVLLTIGLRLAKYTSLFVLLLGVIAQWQVTAAALDPLLSIVAFIAAEATASLPVSGLMGFGAYEGAWSAVFAVACGSPCSSIPVITVAFAIHLITQFAGYSIGILAGFLFVFRELRQVKGKDRA